MDRTTLQKRSDKLLNWRPLGVPLELLFALVLAATLRLYRLGDESIWLDEAYSIVVAQESTWWYLLVEHSGVDPHPPLHYLLTKAWIGVAGSSEFSVRLLSVLLALATIPLLYALARRLFDRWTAGLAATFFAVAPFQIWYAQEARMYALFVFLAVASFYALVLLTEAYSRRRAATYVVTAALLGYAHVFALFVLFAQGLFLLWRALTVPDPERTPLALSFRRLTAVVTGITALLSPWLLALLLRFEESTGRIDWIPEPEPVVFREAFTLLSFGYAPETMYALDAPPRWLYVLVAGCLLLAIVRPYLANGRTATGGAGDSTAEGDGAENDPDDALGDGGTGDAIRALEKPAIALLALWVLVPIVVPYVLSLIVTPIFLHRPVTVAGPAFLLLLARGVRAVPSLMSGSSGSAVSLDRIAQYAVVVLLLTGMVIPLPSYYGGDQKEQWSEAAAFVEETAEPGDVVLISHPYNDRPFLYYFEDEDVEVVPVWPDVSDEELEAAVGDAGQVYVVLRGVWGEDREQLIFRTRNAMGSSHQPEHRQYVGVDVYRIEEFSLDLD